MDMRPVRRKDRVLPEEDCMGLLRKGEYGILSLTGEEGEAYGVPLSYLWLDRVIYFHGARQGRKADMFRANPLACFTIVGATRPIYDKNFTTYYESVMVFGPVSEVADDRECRRILYALAEKYLPQDMDKADAAIRASLPRTLVFSLKPEKISGKAKRPGH